MPPELEVQSLNPWMAKEVQVTTFLRRLIHQGLIRQSLRTVAECRALIWIFKNRNDGNSSWDKFLGLEL